MHKSISAAFPPFSLRGRRLCNNSEWTVHASPIHIVCPGILALPLATHEPCKCHRAPLATAHSDPASTNKRRHDQRTRQAPSDSGGAATSFGRLLHFSHSTDVDVTAMHFWAPRRPGGTLPRSHFQHTGSTTTVSSGLRISGSTLAAAGRTSE